MADRRKDSERKRKTLGVRPKYRYIVESDTRQTIHLPKGVRWRAEKIEENPQNKDCNPAN